MRRAGQWTLREGTETLVPSLPEGLRELLLRRIEALAPEAQQVLEAASVVGEAFAVAAVAAGVQGAIEGVAAVCDGLVAQRHFLDDTGWTVWLDGTRSGVYRFQHALYRQVLYERLGTMRGVQLHGRIGARLEGGYGAQAGEIAAQLAVHFERGGEVQRAVHDRQQADTAIRRNAPHEAYTALRKGSRCWSLCQRVPSAPGTNSRCSSPGGSYSGRRRGVGAPEVGDSYTRAYTLGQQVGETAAARRGPSGGSRQFHSDPGADGDRPRVKRSSSSIRRTTSPTRTSWFEGVILSWGS